MAKMSSESLRRDRLTRRELLKWSGGIGTTLLLAACGAPHTPEPTPKPAGSATTAAPTTAPTVAPAKTTVKYWTWMNSSDKTNPRAQAQAQILDAFRAANPNITLVEEVMPWQELHKQLLQATAANKAPDVCRILDQNLLQLVDAGALQTLDEFVSGWNAERKGDFVYSWDDTVFGGKKYAFRQAIRPMNILYYRTDLYEAAGVNTPPKTLKEFTEVSKATTKGNVIGWQMAFAESGMGTVQFYPTMYWCFDSDLVDLQTGKATFHLEAGQKIHQWLQDMVYVHKVMPAGAASMDVEAVSQVFLSGGMAGHFNHSAKWADWRKKDALKDRLETADPPNFADDASKPAPANSSGWTVTMPKGAKKDAAWKLIEFLHSPEAEIIDAKVGGELPTRKATLKDPFFQTPEAAKMKGWLTYLANNPHPATNLQIKKVEVLNKVLSEAAQQIVVNKADVKSTLAAAAQKYDSQAG